MFGPVKARINLDGLGRVFSEDCLSVASSAAAAKADKIATGQNINPAGGRNRSLTILSYQ